MGFQFPGDAHRVSQVGDDETSHPGYQRHRLGDVPRGWSSEVEQDREVVTLAQLLAYRVEDCLTLIGKATEDQDRLGGDGIDDVANLLVVEQEIDELRDLNVIDGNLGLVPTRNDQVLLLGPLQF